MTINNNIQESYCSFEVAKLLKDKKFQVCCEKAYTDDGKLHTPQTSGSPLGHVNHLFGYSSVSAPTHAIAVEWLRVNFGYFVETVTPDGKEGKWGAGVHKVHGIGNYFDNDGFDSPQEATDAAILYVLQNLIP